MNLNQVTLPSMDLNASVSFYQKMGFNLIVDSIPRYARFECPEGDATFSIHHVENISNGHAIIVYFECSDLESRVQTLIDHGFIFDELPNDKRWLWREAHIRDPDNNQIILYHAGINRKNPPWRVNYTNFRL